MNTLHRPNFLAFCVIVLLLAAQSCRTTDSTRIPCPDKTLLLSTLLGDDGTTFLLYNNGKVYRDNGGDCQFIEQYFEENFLEKNYVQRNGQTFIKADSTTFPTKNSFSDSFQTYTAFPSLFIASPRDTAKFWTTCTLQSPSAPTVEDYVRLRQCIFAGTCDFRDNRIDIVQDPLQTSSQTQSNNVLRFRSVAPSLGMVTAKSSIESTIMFFRKGDDLWFEGRFYLPQSTANRLPYSLVDMENTWFNLSPGPRLVLIDDGKLAFENKFGLKIMTKQPTATAVSMPLGRWVRIKLHIRFDDTPSGLFELWQDGSQIINARGITLPTVNSVQTNLEIGITATSAQTELFVDDIRVSDKPL